MSGLQSTECLDIERCDEHEQPTATQSCRDPFVHVGVPEYPGSYESGRRTDLGRSTDDDSIVLAECVHLLHSGFVHGQPVKVTHRICKRARAYVSKRRVTDKSENPRSLSASGNVINSTLTPSQLGRCKSPIMSMMPMSSSTIALTSVVRLSTSRSELLGFSSPFSLTPYEAAHTTKTLASSCPASVRGCREDERIALECCSLSCNQAIYRVENSSGSRIGRWMWKRRKNGDAKNSGSSRGIIDTGSLPP
jgi:hypothetical protein